MRTKGPAPHTQDTSEATLLTRPSNTRPCKPENQSRVYTHADKRPGPSVFAQDHAILGYRFPPPEPEIHAGSSGVPLDIPLNFFQRIQIMATFKPDDVLKTLISSLPPITPDTDLDQWDHTAVTAASSVVAVADDGTVSYGLHNAYWLPVIQAKVSEGQDETIQTLFTTHVVAANGQANELTRKKLIAAIKPATKTQASDPATALALSLQDLSWEPTGADITEGDVLRSVYTRFLAAWNRHMNSLSEAVAIQLAPAMFAALFLPLLPTYPRARAVEALADARNGNAYGAGIDRITAAITKVAGSMSREIAHTSAQVAALSEVPSTPTTPCFHCVAWQAAHGRSSPDGVTHGAESCHHLQRLSTQHIKRVQRRRAARSNRRDGKQRRRRSSSDSGNGGEGSSTRNQSFRD